MESKGFIIKDLLVRLILIIVFIFLLIWLFPMPDLKPLNSQIFSDNLDRMKAVARTYYTVERLPQELNSYKKMTLREMIDNHLIMPLIDSNGKTCSANDSYIQITKLENEYVIKVYLSCSDKQDYIIEHFGCYDICSDKCKMLETTTTTLASSARQKTTKLVTTGRKTTTKEARITTTQGQGKLYEYQFVKNNCSENLDSYSCPSGYTLAGSTCIKDGTVTSVVDAKKNIEYVKSVDTKDATAVINNSTSLVDAKTSTETKTSTVTANAVKQTVGATAKTVTDRVSATKTTSKDVKGAVATTTTTNATYTVIQNYHVITATKYVTYGWKYDYTKIDTSSGLAYSNANEKLVFVDSWDELTCATCFTTVTKYKYYHYTKTAGEVSYSCDKFEGYSLYDGDKCRKPTTVTKKCPEGYSENGSVCSKSTTTYSCSKYGSDYTLDSANHACVKTITTYSCPSGTKKTSDEKVCTKSTTTYSCPEGTETTSDKTKCIKTTYSCPANTSDKTYTLNGTNCTLKTTSTVYTCPSGTSKTNDKTKCAKQNSKTTYTCPDGYTLQGTKCSKTNIKENAYYTCDKGVLKGQTCIITSSKSDTKKAEEKYKTVCNQEYKWSTNTSIDGWSYTGNKREIK